jgi:nitric oxide reductase NorE protein
MIWVLILTELVTFGLLFAAFAVTRAFHHDVFAAGQMQLNPVLGGINTLVLITSGWLAAMAVDSRSTGNRTRARILLGAAMALGSVFVAIKLAEYLAKAQAGIGIETDTFFTLYFLLTGFHLLHVVLGIVILAAVAFSDSIDNLKTGTAFWHMVDLVWVMMYPLIYLIG